MGNKLKVLCLHGYTSNGQVHAHQMRHITKALPEYEFLFPSGPHQVNVGRPSDGRDGVNQAWADVVKSLSTDGHRAWWSARPSKTANGNESGEYEGLETSLQFLSKVVQDNGPVHAICGFSQGGCFAGLLCAVLSPKLADHPLRRHLLAEWEQPKTGVIIAGFRARYTKYDDIYARPIDIPLLHVLGEKDELVVGGRSDALAEACRNASFLRHPGGHDIPKSTEDKSQIVAYLRRHLGSSAVQQESALM